MIEHTDKIEMLFYKYLYIVGVVFFDIWLIKQKTDLYNEYDIFINSGACA